MCLCPVDNDMLLPNTFSFLWFFFINKLKDFFQSNKNDLLLLCRGIAWILHIVIVYTIFDELIILPVIDESSKLTLHPLACHLVN